MKLLSKYNVLLLIISLTGLLLICGLFYFSFNYYLDRQIDKNLVEESLEVSGYAKDGVFYKANEYEDLIVQYKAISRATGKQNSADTIFYNPIKKYKESARYFKTDLIVGGKNYQLLIIGSKFNRSEEIKSIFLIIFLPVLLLMIIVMAVNGFLMNKIWSPFRKLLSNIQQFNINAEHPFEPIETSISEFKALNNAIMELSQRAKSDYSEIKLFTENASHEMMTPLAVINANLDLMLQHNLLGEEQSELLGELYRATAKLNKLNQSLLLLVKIDNSIVSEETIGVATIIEERIQYFQELVSSRALVVHSLLNNTTIISNRYLFEILVNNLLSNAIRHNVDGGTINILLSENELVVSNTGAAHSLDEKLIFERFHKDPVSDGTGLGLAILKQVCDKLHFPFSYHYIGGLHTFKIHLH